MPIATVKQLYTPSTALTGDSLVEQVERVEALASGSIDARAFFRRNFFTSGLDLLVRRGFDRLAGRSEDGAFYLTQAMGGGKTHSLVALRQALCFGTRSDSLHLGAVAGRGTLEPHANDVTAPPKRKAPNRKKADEPGLLFAPALLAE